MGQNITLTKRRRIDPELSVNTVGQPKIRRFFIDDDEMVDDAMGHTTTQSVNEAVSSHEGAWEIVQGAWWDRTTSSVSSSCWGEWDYRDHPNTGGLEGMVVTTEEDGPRSAPVICVKAMPVLQEPMPRLPSRTVDHAIETLEALARPRGSVRRSG